MQARDRAVSHLLCTVCTITSHFLAPETAQFAPCLVSGVWPDLDQTPAEAFEAGDCFTESKQLSAAATLQQPPICPRPRSFSQVGGMCSQSDLSEVPCLAQAGGKSCWGLYLSRAARLFSRNSAEEESSFPTFTLVIPSTEGRHKLPSCFTLDTQGSMVCHKVQAIRETAGEAFYKRN